MLTPFGLRPPGLPRCRQVAVGPRRLPAQTSRRPGMQRLVTTRPAALVPGSAAEMRALDHNLTMYEVPCSALFLERSRTLFPDVKETV
ncbi:hypothetical protein GCM10027176_04430 [Actinoallomurus bryophytorum]